MATTRTKTHALRHGARALVAAALLAAAGCDRAGNGSGGGGGGGSASDDKVCALDPTGTFTFRVHNRGTETLILDLGCMRTLPLSLQTPQGVLPAGPGSVDTCEFTCDQVYLQQVVPGACTDCGGGYTRTLAPDAATDIAWDRRVYERGGVPSACGPGVGSCARGVAVAPAAAQAGTVTTCPSDQHPTASCLAPRVTAFTIDTRGADATIEVP